eukprot:4915633-Prymnesium_polylepis.2
MYMTQKARIVEYRPRYTSATYAPMTGVTYTIAAKSCAGGARAAGFWFDRLASSLRRHESHAERAHLIELGSQHGRHVQGHEEVGEAASKPVEGKALAQLGDEDVHDRANLHAGDRAGGHGSAISVTAPDTDQTRTRADADCCGEQRTVRPSSSLRRADSVRPSRARGSWICLLYTSPSPRDAHES